MTRFFISIFVFCILSVPAFSQVIEKSEPSYIRTVEFKGNTEFSQIPIIRMGEQLKLSFDALNGKEEDFYYIITHHNFDWTESELSQSEYLDGFDDVRINNYENSLNTLQIFSHYTLTIPNREIRGFKKSGNYLLSVFNAERDLIFTRKFLVVENIASVQVDIKRSRDLKVIDEKQVVHFSVNSPNLILINPKQTVKTVVLQNNDFNTAITNLEPQYTMGNELIYKYDKEASFGGGNEFLAFDNKDVRAAANGIRYVSMSDIYENQLYTNTARYDRPYTYNPDINGNFVVRKLNARNNNIEAEYVRMHFSLQFFKDIGDKEVHLYGSFNNWTIDESTYMEYDSSADVYRNSRLFKQGFYNYKYVVVDRDGTIDHGAVGGDFWEAENDYIVLVYYKELGGRYDRIIGVGGANSSSITNH